MYIYLHVLKKNLECKYINYNIVKKIIINGSSEDAMIVYPPNVHTIIIYIMDQQKIYCNAPNIILEFISGTVEVPTIVDNETCKSTIKVLVQNENEYSLFTKLAEKNSIINFEIIGKHKYDF